MRNVIKECLFDIQNPGFKDILTYGHLQIPKEGITFIKGPSGAGKSTLLKLLNASVSPSSGALFYRGRNLAEMDTVTLRKEVILIGQNVYLFDLSIRENFHEYYRYREMDTPSDETIQKYLKLCHLDFDLNASVTSMSGGERQRVYIAICISLAPEVILMDEPTSALDLTTSKALLADLKVFAKEKGMTMVIVSHDDALSASFADHIIDVKKGGA